MKKVIVVISALFCAIACVFIGVGATYEYERVDTVFINEAIQALDRGTPIEGKYGYVYFASDGKVIYASEETQDLSYDARLSRALAEGDSVADYKDGKIIFYTRSRERFERMKKKLIWFSTASLAVMAAAVAVCGAYVYNRTLRPFKKLNKFALDVAGGNLDTPLLMDRQGTFGAFSEAFDIMRNNLKESRLAEQKASADKRRLLQEIGHDIKTPLASIKAVAECASAQGDDGAEIIIDKVMAIENLVNGFYQASLEEEGQLSVYLTRHTGAEFSAIIENCDYNGRVEKNDPPDCELLYDAIRMGQVLDNIIANSYKYADTDIKVRFNIQDDKFIARISDSGEGVLPEQLNYVMDRFYRGEKKSETVGQGLGLHICKKLIARMGGDMNCFNDGGFVVCITLPVFGKN